MKTAVLVLTANGLALARRLAAEWPDQATILGPSCVVGACGGPGPRVESAVEDRPPRIFETGEPGVLGWLGPLRLAFPAIWEEYDAIVAVMALGIVVRLAGPLALDKRRDPAVVIVDDAGRFAISMLGGHAARANELTYAVARTLGATPVVTTASKAHALPAVGEIGRDLG